jgi:hypothetical protein
VGDFRSVQKIYNPAIEVLVLNHFGKRSSEAGVGGDHKERERSGSRGKTVPICLRDSWDVAENKKNRIYRIITEKCLTALAKEREENG